MKVAVNDQELFTLNETKKKVIKDSVSADIFDNDMKRRLEWVLMHKYERCFEHLRKEWTPKLEAAGLQTIPLDKDAFAELVFAQPTYKDRLARDAESQI